MLLDAVIGTGSCAILHLSQDFCMREKNHVLKYLLLVGECSGITRSEGIFLDSRLCIHLHWNIQ